MPIRGACTLSRWRIQARRMQSTLLRRHASCSRTPSVSEACVLREPILMPAEPGLFRFAGFGYNSMKPRPGGNDNHLRDRQFSLMGTSTSQRSPGTPQWEAVRDLYRAGVRDPAEISRGIVHALDENVQAQMAGRGVVTCLDSLLDGARSAARSPLTGPLENVASALGAAGSLRVAAERRLAINGLGSRFSDLALDALGSSALDALTIGASASSLSELAVDPVIALSAFHNEGRLHELAQRFLSQDVDRCFRYFVTRDISEFVGADVLPTVGDARALTDDVAAHCSGLAGALPFAPHENELQEVRSLDPTDRVALMQVPFRHLMAASLDVISGG